MRIDNTFLKSSISFLVDLIPYSFVKLINKRELIIPLYHAISDRRIPHIENIYHVKSSKDFERDLDFLLRFYNPISFDDFYNSVLNDKKIQKPSFLLTFDDGLIEFKEIIAPILLRKGIPAICFLNSGFLDNKELFYRHKASLLISKINELGDADLGVLNWKTNNFPKKLKLNEAILSVNYQNKFLLDELACAIEYDFGNYLRNCKPYLSTEDIICLQEKGFRFGAHSIDHPRYSLINPDKQFEQTESSIAFIRERFKIQEKLFAFPFSDRGVDKCFFDKIYQEQIVDITFGTSGFDKRRLYFNHIQRVSFDEDLSARTILCIHSLYNVAKQLGSIIH